MRTPEPKKVPAVKKIRISDLKALSPKAVGNNKAFIDKLCDIHPPGLLVHVSAERIEEIKAGKDHLPSSELINADVQGQLGSGMEHPPGPSDSKKDSVKAGD